MIWGDYYNADTRVLIAVLKIAGVPCEQIMMNTLANEHKESKIGYDLVNPSGSIPTVVEGSYKILGGNNAQITYLCSTHLAIQDKLCPTASQKEIMVHLNWFQR